MTREGVATRLRERWWAITDIAASFTAATGVKVETGFGPSGVLRERIEKGDRVLLRRLNPDRHYRTPNGGELALPGRSLMLVRNVGHHMMSDAVTLRGEPIP